MATNNYIPNYTEEQEQEIMNDLIRMQSDMERTINEVVKAHNKGSSAKRCEDLDLAGTEANRPPESDFVLPGLEAGALGAIVSPGGAGKSMMAMQIAAQVAGGTDLLGLGPIATGKAVYMASEDSKTSITQRFHALCKLMKREDHKSVFANLKIQMLFEGQPNIFDQVWIDHITEAAQGGRLVIIDTLRRFHQADENSSTEMSQLLHILEGIAKATGCAIVFLHHTNKGATYSGSGDMQQASKGSAVLVDHPRWQAFLVGMTKEEAKIYRVDDDMRGYYVRFGLSKQNSGPPVGDKWFRRQDGGILQPAVLTKEVKTTAYGTHTSGGDTNDFVH